MTIDFASISAAFLLGLLSSAHCVGMCGGIMGALTMAIPADAKRQRWVILLGYNVARILSYGFIGLLLGGFAHQLMLWGGQIVLRWLAGLLLIAMGLYLAGWWKGLTYLEAAGKYLWAYLQPLSRKVMPVNSLPKALALGAIWGWLPCGLVYSALMFAVAQGQAAVAGLIMLAFGLGTLPSVLLSGVFAQTFGSWLRITQIRWFFAVIIIIYGVWTILGAEFHAHKGHDHQMLNTQPMEQHGHSQMHHHSVN